MTSVRVKITRILFVAVLLLAMAPIGAQAQDGISASPKGTIGAALIGAELGLAVPSILGVEELWPYLVAPAVGAGAGVAIGLLVIDKDGTSPKLATAILAAGSALLIPSLVWAVSASAYEPEDDDFTASAITPAVAAVRAGTGLLRFSPQGTFVAAPGVAIAPGTQSRPASVEVSLLSGRFH